MGFFRHREHLSEKTKVAVSRMKRGVCC